MSTPQWASLGIDVGSSRNKVFALCLYDPEDGGVVSFEMLKAPALPSSLPGVFEDTSKPFPWLADAAAKAIAECLRGSVLVRRFLKSKAQYKRVCVDAPSGFAQSGASSRDTERACSVRCWPTPNQTAFLSLFGPPPAHPSKLQAEVFWKQVGFACYAWFAEQCGLGVAKDIGPLDIARLAAQGGVEQTLRESFPSQTYHVIRQCSVEAPVSVTLEHMCQLNWDYSLIHRNAAIRLDETRKAIVNRRQQPEHFMELFQKRKDGQVGDYLDAFVSMLLGVLEEQDQAELLGQDRARLESEGAIISPLTVGRGTSKQGRHKTVQSQEDTSSLRNVVIEKLIKLGRETDSLDFKERQYHQQERVALLKDIMAMANANVDGDRHIIVGVHDPVNGQAEVVGIRDTLTDAAKYKQLILSNIEPEVKFEYEAAHVDGKLLGVFRIHDCTDRPYMMKKDCDSQLQQGDCYIRKGTQQCKATRADFDSFMRIRG